MTSAIDRLTRAAALRPGRLGSPSWDRLLGQGRSFGPIGPAVTGWSPPGRAARSTAKSTVSARFVAATRARLDERRNRDLSGRRWLVVYVDGFE